MTIHRAILNFKRLSSLPLAKLVHFIAIFVQLNWENYPLRVKTLHLSNALLARSVLSFRTRLHTLRLCTNFTEEDELFTDSIVIPFEIFSSSQLVHSHYLP